MSGSFLTVRIQFWTIRFNRDTKVCLIKVEVEIKIRIKIKIWSDLRRLRCDYITCTRLNSALLPLFFSFSIDISAYFFELILINIILILIGKCIISHKFIPDHVKDFRPYLLKTVIFLHVFLVQNPCDWQIICSQHVSNCLIRPPWCFGSHRQFLILNLIHASCIYIWFRQFVTELLFILKTVTQLLIPLYACICYQAYLTRASMRPLLLMEFSPEFFHLLRVRHVDECLTLVSLTFFVNRHLEEVLTA